MAVEEDDAGGIPEWVVTFGDLMSLLLTFFIMLVSLSEIKKDEQFQALAEALRKQFGHEATITSVVPGQSQPRNSVISKLATMGRSRRLDMMRGGDKQRAPSGNFRRVRLIRPGQHSGIGSVIHFEEGMADLNNESRGTLQFVATDLLGKPQRIEIRGHTSRKPLDPALSDQASHTQAMDLAYKRCQQTLEFLASLGIERQRFRISVAGPNEPIDIGTDPDQLKQNPRVEVFLLDEIVADLEGDSTQKKQQFVDPALRGSTDHRSSDRREESPDG
ncbi:MAG: OmpA family protein [Pirellulaceae bacterium]|nr:OmpA family protein [Pirellulaceae bacterium]